MIGPLTGFLTHSSVLSFILTLVQLGTRHPFLLIGSLCLILGGFWTFKGM